MNEPEADESPVRIPRISVFELEAVIRKESPCLDVSRSKRNSESRKTVPLFYFLVISSGTVKIYLLSYQIFVLTIFAVI